MVFSLDSINIDKLLEDVKNLFRGKESFIQPSTPAYVDAPEKSTRYKSPIHSEWHNLGGFKGKHHGVDMSAQAGTPIYSLSEGVVDSVGTDGLGGNVVNIVHSNNMKTYYAHLATVKVHKGDKVDINTIIGTVGNTGNAGDPNDPLKTKEDGRTWPHCHFEVKQNGAQVDPAKFFNIPAYDPQFAKNPGKYQKFWASEKAKQEAEAFNMREHTSQRRAAFTRDVAKLVKLANQFYKLSCGN